MLIREFKVSDASEVSSLIRRAIFERDNRNYSLEQIYSIINHYSIQTLCSDLNRRKIYVALENDSIIGTAMNKQGEFIIYILPEYQKKGIGTKLMRFLEDGARNEGLSKVLVIAVLSAISFYEKLGYSFVQDKIHPEWGMGKIMEKYIR